MANEVIPDDVRDFIMQYVDSIAQLEALLLLRANSGESWDAVRIAARLYVSEQEITDALNQLGAAELLSCKDQLYRYECSPGLVAAVDRLAETYRHHLIPVTNLIHSKRRIREFANAFKFRKDK